MPGIEQDVRDAIAKNLPAQTADVLRQRLDAIDALEAEAGDLRAKTERLEERVAKLVQRETDLVHQLDGHADLRKREAEVAARERNAEIEALKVQLQAEQTVSAKVTDLFAGLVRNTTFRKSFWHGEHHLYDPSTGQSNPHVVTQGEEATEE